jgi:membrane AbrB-like protein
MNKPQLTENIWIRFICTFIVAIIGGAIFKIVHMPIPWLLGPMICVFIGSRCLKAIKPFWPGYIRNTGMIIIGYSIGLSFTLSTLLQIGQQLPSMVLMTLLLLCFCVIIAYCVSKLSGVPFPTVLTGSIPGGLSQMIVLAEETEGIDLTVVTFLQVSRLMMIIFFVPLLIFSPLFGTSSANVLPFAFHAATASWGELFPNILVFAVVCTVCAFLGKRIKFPTAFLLGPMIATAVLNISGLHGPTLPSIILNGSQFMIGGYIGLLLNPENLKNKFKIISLAIVSGIVLILGAVGLGFLLTKMHAISHATAFLSLSPGGMDQMGIIAQEVNADITIVTCYQLFRILFIFFAVPPLLKVVFKAIHRTRSVDGHPEA